MDTTAPTTLSLLDLHNRRRGFQIVSRLARQQESPGRHLARLRDESLSARRSPGDEYAPRHRHEDPPSFLLTLELG